MPIVNAWVPAHAPEAVRLESELADSEVIELVYTGDDVIWARATLGFVPYLAGPPPHEWASVRSVAAWPAVGDRFALSWDSGEGAEPQQFVSWELASISPIELPGDLPSDGVPCRRGDENLYRAAQAGRQERLGARGAVDRARARRARRREAPTLRLDD